MNRNIVNCGTVCTFHYSYRMIQTVDNRCAHTDQIDSQQYVSVVMIQLSQFNSFGIICLLIKDVITSLLLVNDYSLYVYNLYTQFFFIPLPQQASPRILYLLTESLHILNNDKIPTSDKSAGQSQWWLQCTEDIIVQILQKKIQSQIYQ